MLNDNYDGFFWINFLAALCQLESFDMLVRDKSNTEILKELGHQNTDYLEEIKNDVKEIKKMLEVKKDA